MSKPDKLCIVCGKSVKPEDQDEHLRSQHLGPHYFRFNGRPYRVNEPSMLIRDLVRLVDASPMYDVFEDRDGKQIYYGHGVAIDLTHQPQLWAIPPATQMRARLGS